MPLRDIMNAIKTLEESLTISSPLAISHAAGSLQAYLISPSRDTSLATFVTFMNWPDVASEQRLGNSREDAYTVQIDCLVNLGDIVLASDAALAMFDATFAAFDNERLASNRLSQTVDYLTLRSERPMVELITWNNVAYPGFHLFLDVTAFKELP